MKCRAIILGGGSGRRMGAGINKVLLPLRGIPVLMRSVLPFVDLCDGAVIAAAPDEIDTVRGMVRQHLPDGFVLSVVPGGAERQDSVRNAFLALPADTNCVLIHDGARALVTKQIIEDCIRSAAEKGSGIASIPVTDTIKVADADGAVLSTPRRDTLFAMQTPQAVRVSDYRIAMERADAEHFYATDDAALLEHAGLPVYLCPGSRENLKLTTPIDLLIAERILEERDKETNV